MEKRFDKQKRSISGKKERVNYVSFYSFWSTLLCNYFGQVTYIVILFSFFFFPTFFVFRPMMKFSHWTLLPNIAGTFFTFSCFKSEEDNKEKSWVPSSKRQMFHLLDVIMNFTCGWSSCGNNLELTNYRNTTTEVHSTDYSLLF